MQVQGVVLSISIPKEIDEYFEGLRQQDATKQSKRKHCETRTAPSDKSRVRGNKFTQNASCTE